MNIDKLRGFREIYPEEMYSRKRVFETIKNVAENFGFSEIDGPSVEPLELFEVKSGQELVSQTFSFKDKSGRLVTLIPEITPTVSRMIAKRKDLSVPVKWYSFPKLWRYEEPQSGRLREFYQFNADIFGVSNVEADAEIIVMAISILNSLGLKGKYKIKISDRILIENVLKQMGVENIEEMFRIIDKSDKISQEDFEKMLGEYLDNEQILKLTGLLKFEGSAEDLKSLIDSEDKEIRNRLEILQTLENYFKAYSVTDYKFDFATVRGLSYYTGIVFEAKDEQREFRSILGGGRYDKIVELFGSRPVPAVGFGMGDVVLEMLMRREGLWASPPAQLDYYIINDDKFRTYAIQVLSKLRNYGFMADINMIDRTISNQFKYANKIKAKNVIIIGEQEQANNAISIKNMESGDQVSIPFSEFFEKKIKSENIFKQ
jgi:histidyl-tRNA synthetase